ncbi:hypothetical protein CYLTODRAFT_356774 [Cylindrobasidium torrendii FP15055 ss-10]|uniref:Protein kinase domain-containing protein n=1 Tax=Cylindrobasidium torrendii FP15055 ss-10 TaxID=1314674 RepID=A0A0D7B4P3_9AGAR|nr:hypothetical protein CYLTODRAFT_356774 [Cylindrobasidium torrendii FP15055 ss-10]
MSVRQTRIPTPKGSKILHASLRLQGRPDPLLVHVKVASGSDLSEATEKLEREAKTLAELPAHFSEDWSGFQYMKEFEYDHKDGILPAHAVAPKFYGYYVPEGRVDRMLLRPFIVFEDCGMPIDVNRMSANDRATVYSFAHRLHRRGIVHGAIEAPNVLVQPGPLSKPPSQRSIDTPSYRIVNWGAALQSSSVTRKEWDRLTHDEVEDAKEAFYGKFVLRSKPLKKSGYEVIARKHWVHHKPVYRWVDV